MTLILGPWSMLQEDAAQVRVAVFVREQGIPLELEWDAADEQSLHALIRNDAGDPVATGRLLPDGHIGRMAVLSNHRRLGLGGQILEALVDAAARKGHPQVMLSAQVHARSFYQRHGFLAQGEVYDEVGIPHQTMVRVLVAQDPVLRIDTQTRS
jgi:predicted GNAT family N-acyltransferase